MTHPSSDEMPEVTCLFLYLKTGGGHLAPARAISDAMKRQSDNTASVELFDGLEGSSRLARFLIEDGYRILQSRARWYFALLYFLNKFRPLAWLNVLLVSAIIKPGLKNRIIHSRPEAIVLFHFLLIKPTMDIIRSMKLVTPVITIVTDPYTAHPIWFLTRSPHYVVFSDRLKSRCISKGIPEESVSLFPFPVSHQYSRVPGESELLSTRQRFGVRGKAVLIFGGGDGMPRGETILRHLLEIEGFDILMVCGRNKQLLKRIEQVIAGRYEERVKLFGFVDFVHELISIADVVISKCGASTFMEILLLEKIPVVTDYLWEQEKGNVEFLQKHRLGFFEPNLARLPELIKDLLSDKALSASIQTNIRRMHLRSGSEEIASWLLRREFSRMASGIALEFRHS